jgi:hypothetical protein
MTNVTSIGGAQDPYAAGATNGFKQTAADLKTLEQALQTGDLAGAQQAFSSLQQDSPWISRALSSTNGGGSSPFASALQSLAGALKSGDVNAAQQAFANLQQAMHSGHHGHHHHGSGSASAATSPTGTTPPPDASTGAIDTTA